MGCCGSDREKASAVRAEQKWEYINLDDFKSRSCWAPFTYGFLWFNLFISVSVYCVDTFTAVNLLAFDRWSGQIKPVIPLHISRWIFAGCIIASFILLFYRWIRAIRVMKGSGVAQSYLDPLALRIQSVRLGKEGRGWKRFLVFTELTKSRKGADYVALFTFYSFEAWTRIVFAEGPRTVINALTLWSVLQADLIPTGKHAASNGHSPVAQFFVNIGILATANKEQAAVLIGMLWTLIIWVISALSLFASLVLYLLFLFHHIPSEDGGLSNYCRRKINRRMERIIKAKVDKALKEEGQIRVRKDGKDIKRQPTLPVFNSDEEAMPGLSRQVTQTTLTTLPEYTSQEGSDRSSGESLSRQPTLPDLKINPNRPPPPSRTATHGSSASWASYNSNAPLMGDVAGMGYGQPGDVQTPASASSATGWYSRPPPSRAMTGMSQSTQRSYTPGTGPPRSGSAQSGRNFPGAFQMEPLSRPDTALSSGPGPNARSTPGPSPVESQGRRIAGNQYNPYFPPLPESGRNTPVSGSHMPPTQANPYPPPLPQSSRQFSAPQPSTRSQTPAGAMPPRSFTPAGSRSMTPGAVAAQTTAAAPLPRVQTMQSPNDSGYMAYSPDIMSGTPTSARQASGPYRAFTQPNMLSGPPLGSGRQTPQYSKPAYPPPRSGTAPPLRRQNTQESDLDDIMNGYR